MEPNEARYPAWRVPLAFRLLEYLGPFIGIFAMFFVPGNMHSDIRMLIGALPGAVAYAFFGPTFDHREQDLRRSMRSSMTTLWRGSGDWERAWKRAFMTAGVILGLAILIDWADLRHIWAPVVYDD